MRIVFCSLFNHFLIRTVIINKDGITCDLELLLINFLLYTELNTWYLLSSGVARNFWAMGHFPSKLFRGPGNNRQLNYNVFKNHCHNKTYVYWREIRHCRLRVSSVGFFGTVSQIYSSTLEHSKTSHSGHPWIARLR
jgi:hypothetical protein